MLAVQMFLDVLRILQILSMKHDFAKIVAPLNMSVAGLEVEEAVREDSPICLDNDHRDLLIHHQGS